jgi:protein-tyrosine phosphatase
MAEKLMQHALAAEAAPLNTLRVRSFGTAAMDGETASEGAQSVLAKVGLSLEKHRSASVRSVDLGRALAFFCMTAAHKRNLVNQYRVPAEKVHLMREWVEGGDPAIPDPYGQDIRAYQECFNAMVEAMPSLLRHLRDLAGNRANECPPTTPGPDA